MCDYDDYFHDECHDENPDYFDYDYPEDFDNYPDVYGFIEPDDYKLYHYFHGPDDCGVYCVTCGETGRSPYCIGNVELNICLRDIDLPDDPTIHLTGMFALLNRGNRLMVLLGR